MINISDLSMSFMRSEACRVLGCADKELIVDFCADYMGSGNNGTLYKQIIGGYDNTELYFCLSAVPVLAKISSDQALSIRFPQILDYGLGGSSFNYTYFLEYANRGFFFSVLKYVATSNKFDFIINYLRFRRV